MRVLLLNQCFYPDVVSTAQHLTDLAVELSARGHHVTVLTSDRGYDDPTVRFPLRERWRGIDIIRIKSLALGKRSRWKRALNFGSFLSNTGARLLLLKRFDAIVALTSPPLISFLGALFVKLKGGRLLFWVMDLNPDEAIAAGWLRENSLTSRFLKSLLGYSLKTATQVVALDRFMKNRITEKGIDAARISVVPPWAHDDAVQYSPSGRDRFRQLHSLSDKYVVMYSGNHSPCHPLDTLLEAAHKLSVDPKFVFCFVGGGSEQDKVRRYATEYKLKNIVCLPYQPLHSLSDSLSAADLQVVVMGEEFTGIIHPCKIYNILRIGLPILYIGPAESHVMDLGLNGNAGFNACQHGDVTAVVAAISAASSSCDIQSESGAVQFSKTILLPQLVAVIETGGIQTPRVIETVSTEASSTTHTLA